MWGVAKVVLRECNANIQIYSDSIQVSSIPSLCKRGKYLLKWEPIRRIDHVAVVYSLRPTPDTMSLASKKDEENGLSTYYNNKTTVIQEARVFNDSPISPRKCRALLTRIVYLLYVGETFTTQEATTLFFGTTKLFQHKDVSRLGPYVAKNRYLISSERTPSNGLPRDQGARYDGGGCHYGHEQYNEGHAAQLRSHLPAKCHSCALPYHRRTFASCYCKGLGT